MTVGPVEIQCFDVLRFVHNLYHNVCASGHKAPPGDHLKTLFLC